MIQRIEALGFRSLRDVDVALGRFEILVGPNGSGKSSLLDAVAFLGDLLRAGPARAVRGDPRLMIAPRSPDPAQLNWMRRGERFELAVEASIPAAVREKFRGEGYDACRYEVAVGAKSDGEVSLLAETLWLQSKPPAEPAAVQGGLFAEPGPPRASLLRPPGGKTPPGWRKVVNKVLESGNDYYFAETSGWNGLFRLGPGRSALGNLPEDESRFPAATWFKRLLMEGVQRIALRVDRLRRPSPPGLPAGLLPDGSNLPWIVAGLEKSHPECLGRWVAHLRSCLPELCAIQTVEREADRHRHLVLACRGGLEVPSWLVSDGTLRLLALTLPAFLPGLNGIHLIEEPENGIHPRAVETLFAALASVPAVQILCASHSPLIVGRADPAQVLCFTRSEASGTAVVRGSRHPRLNAWRGAVDLDAFSACGVLE
jgi:predicted ATPase